MDKPLPLSLKLKIKTKMPIAHFPFWAGLLFFAVYLLIFSGEVSSLGELAILNAGNSLAQNGIAQINSMAWAVNQPDMFTAWAKGGNLMLSGGEKLAWIFVPLLWLGHQLPAMNALQWGLLTNGFILAIVTALLAWGLPHRSIMPRTIMWAIIAFGTLAVIGKLEAAQGGDPIWLIRNTAELPVRLYLLLPPAILLLTVVGNLYFEWRGEKPMPIWVVLLLTIFLTGLSMRNFAHFAAAEQTSADTEMLEKISLLPPDASLWVSLPADDDPQSFSAWVTGYVDSPNAVTIWADAETSPENMAINLAATSKNLWLYERGLSPADATPAVTRWLNQNAFPIAETWLDGSGRLSEFAVFPADMPAVPLDIPFEHGVTVQEFAVSSMQIQPAGILGVKLNWRADTESQFAPPTTVFLQLLNADGVAVAQADRLLLDPKNPAQSPLLPDEKLSLGYGLTLPNDLSAGEYALVMGLYDTKTLKRYTRTDGNPDDFLYLTTIVAP